MLQRTLKHDWVHRFLGSMTAPWVNVNLGVPPERRPSKAFNVEWTAEPVHTDGKDNKVNTTSDFCGLLPNIRDIVGTQSVSFDRDGLSRVEVRFDRDVAIEYVEISQKEDNGNTVAWGSIN